MQQVRVGAVFPIGVGIYVIGIPLGVIALAGVNVARVRKTSAGPLGGVKHTLAADDAPHPPPPRQYITSAIIEE